MNHLAFKQLTLTNWTEPDPVNEHFARLSPIIGVVPMAGSDWARAFVARQLGHRSITTTEQHYGHLERNLLSSHLGATDAAITRAGQQR